MQSGMVSSTNRSAEQRFDIMMDMMTRLLENFDQGTSHPTLRDSSTKATLT